MFNIGFGELAVICIVLIIAVGPDRLPSMMKTLGKTIRTLRQASRDIRASTGIDELMREDFDLYAPLKPAAPRRPAPLPAPQPEPEAVPATANADVPTTPASNVETQTATGPQPVSREDVVEEAQADRVSVVVAPPPQAVGLPPETLPEALPPEQLTAAVGPQPAAAATPDPQPAAAQATGNANATAIASNVDTLPRAPIIQSPDAHEAEAPETAAPSEPKPVPPTEA